MKTSPTCSVPFCTSTVATGPRPLSTRDSSTVPLAGASGSAFSSRKSPTSRIISSRRGRFCFVLAETSTITVSPPHSSGISPRSASWRFTRSGWASGLVNFVDGDDDRHVRPTCACAMASSVCGITPSSAATTSTTMSVTFAPRARMRVNASWPGVSMKTMRRSPTCASYAPMCCVIPPASPAATSVSRMASSRLVLPWSTWPITVTTGARGCRLPVRSSLIFSSWTTCSSNVTTCTIPLKDSARLVAVGTSSA